MLAGIKRGKKKQKRSDKAVTPAASAAAAPVETNVAAAAALKAALGRGEAPTTQSSAADSSSSSIVASLSSPEVSWKRQEDMTVVELAAQERRQQGTAYDEETRALMRSKKRRKASANVDSDEEVAAWMDQRKHSSKQKDGDAKQQQRWHNRQLAAHDQQAALAQQSWWWMESSRFQSASVVSTTPTTSVSLAVAPAGKSWHPNPRKYPHFYLVPQHTATASGASCDETVWQDVQRYQQALRQWTQQSMKNKGVLFAEVVLPSRNRGAFYQARIHAMVVPNRLHQDAALVFQSALQELVLDHGTHQTKLLSLKSGKPLPHLVPSHFGYIYVEWEDRGGSVLVLEERHRDVTVDWPLDVLSGRLGLDPPRMRRRDAAADDNLQARVQAIQETWKDYDWTLASSEGAASK